MALQLKVNKNKTYSLPSIQVYEVSNNRNIPSNRAMLVVNTDMQDTVRKVLNRTKDEYSETFKELSKK